MKTLLMATLVSLSMLSTPSLAHQHEEENEVVITKEQIETVAKSIAKLMFLMENFGNTVKQELERHRNAAASPKNDKSI